MNPRRPAWAVLFALVSACGDADPAAEPPLIRQFTVDGAALVRVEAGRPVVLAWEVSRATRIRISQEPGGELLTDAAPVGTFRTAPLASATQFVLVAFGPGGEASRVVQASVEESDAVQVSFFRAVPETLLPGESCSLSWEVQRAEQIRIDAIGGEVILAGDPRASGTVNVSPAVTTTYLLTASGPKGPALSAATVVVQGSPRVLAFRAEPSRIERGEQARLIYRAENAERAMIFDASGAILHSSTEPVGDLAVRPERTETYTLSLAKTGFPEVRATLVLPVDQPPGAQWRSARATPESVDYGDSVEVAFEAENAPNGVRAEFRGMEIHRSADASGVFTFTPTTSGSLALIAINEVEGNDRRTLELVVRPVAPRILGFSAHPSIAILGRSYGLGFEVRGADELEIHEGDVIYPLDPNGPGALSLVASSTLATLELEARNRFGETRTSLLVPATDQPLIDVLTVEPEVFDGQTVTATLSYVVRNASAIEFSGPNGASGRFATPFLAVGGFVLALQQTGFVRLRAENGFGVVLASRAVARLSPEREPNELTAEAQALEGDGSGVRGRLESSNDVDLYGLLVEEGASVLALLGRRSLGCPALGQIELQLLDVDGTSVLAEASEDEGEGCLAIRPGNEPGARELPDGLFYLRVQGQGGLDYVLTASVAN